MDLSPNDIRNYEFSTQMRGYTKDEVDSLLDQAAAMLDAVKQENLKLSMEVDSLKSQLAALRQFEDTIKSAAIDARRNADTTMGDAKKEAELILTKARDEADQVLEFRIEKLAELDSKIAASELAKKSYLNKVHGIITSHLEIIDHLIDQEPSASERDDDEDHDRETAGDNGKIEVTHSGEVDRKQMETIGTPSISDGPRRTEDANADEIVEASLETDSEVAAMGDTEANAEEADPSKPVDPELAQALQQYQTSDGSPSEHSDQPPSPDMQAQPPGQFVETSARAEDIPPGFIVGPSADGSVSNSDEKSATDKLLLKDTSTAKKDSDKSEHPPVSPEDLAEELDNVVAKFDEEMDKAAQS
jgi:cell division initiation protein